MKGQPEFLKATENLGIETQQIRRVADELYLQYMHQSLMVFDKKRPNEKQRRIYWMVLGAIQVLENLLNSWGKSDVVQALKDMVSDDDVDMLAKRRGLR